MASKKQNSIDLAERMAVILGQFKNLDNKDPSLWPTVPKVFLYLAVMAAVAVASWFMFLKDYETELEEARSKETALGDGYRQKLVKAVNLDVLKKQREQIQQYVIQLEKQLPSKAEMAALLSDINHARHRQRAARSARSQYADAGRNGAHLQVSGSRRSPGAKEGGRGKVMKDFRIPLLLTLPVVLTACSPGGEGGG